MVIYAADGYCRSETIVAVYLQKKESAKRIYATLVHSKSNSDGYKDRGITCELFASCIIFLIFSHFICALSARFYCVCTDYL